jgi:hypothetical protein
MADEIKTAIYNAHLEGRSKYVYFLLAAAGACIAFAVTQTQTIALSLWQIPLGLAVLCWGASFSFGCWHLQTIAGTLYDNMDLIEARDGKHPASGRDPAAIAHFADYLKNGMNKASRRAAFYYRWQCHLLIAGAILYVGWHISAMYLRRHVVTALWAWVALEVLRT